MPGLWGRVGVRSDDPLAGAGKVLAMVSLSPCAAPEEDEVCGDIVRPFEPARLVTVDWAGIRVTDSDVLERVLTQVIPGEDVLAPQCHLMAGSMHSGPRGDGAPRGHHAGRLWPSHALQVAGRPPRVIVHKPPPTAAYSPSSK